VNLDDFGKREANEDFEFVFGRSLPALTIDDGRLTMGPARFAKP